MLPKIQRLTKRGSFAYVYKNGNKKHDAALSLIFVKSKRFRIGFSVNNKVGKAVVRNKLKRRLRAIVRSLACDILPVQAVIVAKADAAKLEFAQLSKCVERLLQNAKLLPTR